MHIFWACNFYNGFLADCIVQSIQHHFLREDNTYQSFISSIIRWLALASEMWQFSLLNGNLKSQFMVDKFSFCFTLVIRKCSKENYSINLDPEKTQWRINWLHRHGLFLDNLLYSDGLNVYFYTNTILGWLLEFHNKHWNPIEQDLHVLLFSYLF